MIKLPDREGNRTPERASDSSKATQLSFLKHSLSTCGKAGCALSWGVWLGARRALGVGLCVASASV